MVSLLNRADHYIFALWFLSSSIFHFFPRLISVAADWMSTILRHMMWPQCKFRMQVWRNVLQAARWKYRTQKWCKKSPFEHHRTILSGHVFATKACINNRKKLVKQQYLLQMSLQYGELRPLTAEIDWRVWGTPSYFNRYRVLAALLHSNQVVGVSQTLRHWTEGATYVRQGDHHVGYWPTF